MNLLAMQGRRSPAELPPAAAAKLRALRQQAADSAALAQSATATVMDLESRPREERSRLSTQIEAAKKTQAARQKRRADDAQVVAQMERFLALVPADQRLVAGPPPDDVADLGLDELAESLRSTRENIERLGRERRSVSLAPLPASRLKALAKEHVLQLSLQGVPTLDAKAKPTWPHGTRAEAVVAWLDPDAMHARLCREIDVVSPGRDALSEEERVSRLASIDAELLSLERSEETLVSRLRELGGDAHRRPRADPRAVLGVEIAKPTAKVQGVGKGTLPAMTGHAA